MDSDTLILPVRPELRRFIRVYEPVAAYDGTKGERGKTQFCALVHVYDLPPGLQATVYVHPERLTARSVTPWRPRVVPSWHGRDDEEALDELVSELQGLDAQNMSHDAVFWDRITSVEVEVSRIPDNVKSVARELNPNVIHGLLLRRVLVEM